MSEMNMPLRKWVKKYIKERFNDDIERILNDESSRGGSREREELEGNETKIILQTVVNKMVKTREINEMITALKRLKNSTDNEENIESNVNLDNIEENLQSFRSDDLTSENWCPLMGSRMEGNNLSMIFDEIAMDKPVHVRLGGFETLFESDLSNNCNSDAFEQLLKLLKDGMADMTKTVFEASLKVHSKLLDSPRSHDVYTNLINSFEAEYHSEKCHESLPNFATGINLKIFFHEKLLRILHVIVKYHKEILKITRTVDRTMEEMIDQFIILLTYDVNKQSTHCKRLSPLNLVSLLEPHADWSTKWMYCIGTRKTFITAVSKSPSLFHTIWNIVEKGLEQPTFNGALAYSIKDDAIQSMYRSVYISGDTVETITYLHCLNFVSQINNCLNIVSASMSLDSSTNLPVSSVDFLLALIKSLNFLATTTTPKTIYNTSQHALNLVLHQPTCSFDSHVGRVALIPLCNLIGENNGNLWPHTIDMINFILQSKDGLIFLTSPYESMSPGNSSPMPPAATPASSLINYTSNILRQPIAVMNVDHVVEILELVGKLFDIIVNFDVIYEILQNQLYPSVEYLYNKIQKFSIRQENKSQLLDSALKDMLLKIVAWPLGLQLLPDYPVTFEELIRGSINPFRHSWSSNEIISFITSVTYFDEGCKLMIDLVPHTISMLLNEINDNMEIDKNSVDLKDCEHIQKFTHVLSLFSLNTKCFLIFMMEEDSTDENYSDPRNLTQIFKHTVIFDSPFHYISLLALETVIWNLDILIYLLNSYNLQAKLLQLQDFCRLKVTKHKDEGNNDDEDEEFSNSENQSQENKIGEMHEVYLIDETSLLRNRILSKSYFIRHKLEKLMNDQSLEKCIIYSSFPPSTCENDGFLFSSTSECAPSELDELLQDCKPGLRDSGWVIQVRNAHGNSPGQMKHSTYFNLLNQMEGATAAVEWIDMFKWKNSQSSPIIYEWLQEEIIGLELVIRFAEDHWEIPDNKSNVVDNLKQIFQSIHTFIKYQKGEYFEAFDWFLGTVFIICDGNFDRCKKFVKNLVRFPSAIYMWHIHGVSYDVINGQTLATQFTLAQQIDFIVNQEFPALNHAMTNECGIKWWMICNRFLSQCFWGILEWSEIIHFLTICILYPPDHIVYYFVSLLQHCEEKIMQDIVTKKYWPENIDLSSYQCHNYIAYMDRLAKKYQNNILSSLNQSKSSTLHDAE